MRTETEIAALHQQLLHRHLAGHDEAVGAVVTILNWVCNSLVPDADIEETITAISEMDKEGCLDPEDVLDALPEAVMVDAAAKHLKIMAIDLVEQTAAAARKLDRLCKAELKERKP